MKLEWLPRALTDRDEIYTFICADSQRAALRIDDSIESQVDQLIQYPLLGRPGRASGSRELLIQGTPYIAGYKIDGDTIFVLRVLHAARSWPNDFDGDV